MKRYLLGLFFMVLPVVFVVCPSAHADEDQGGGFYTVKQGDTLWGIASKELGDPGSWPKIWEENPFISNPNSLRPGLQIRIPHGLDYGVVRQKVVELPLPPPTEEKKAEEPPKGKEITVYGAQTYGRLFILSGGYIARKENVQGSIIGAPTDRKLFAANEYAYVNTTTDDVKKFYIVRMDREIRHPVTKKFLGYVTSFRGVIEVTGTESGYKKAVVREVLRDIEIGDLLIPYYEVDRPQISNKEQPEAKGVIVGSSQFNVASATGDFVYIDKGAKDGIGIDDVFTVTASKGQKRPLGKIKVVALQNETATAQIISSTSDIMAGDTY